ncbi:MAG: hypothetical protein V8R01_02995 [Bacilli bacterium]
MDKRDIIVNGYAYPFIEKETLDKTLPYLTFLSIFSYHIKADGSLVSIDDVQLIGHGRKSKCRSENWPVTNMDESGFDSELVHTILNDQEIQKILIDTVLEIAAGLKIIMGKIDFEYINPSDKELYNEFIRKISNILHDNNYILITSLAPKTSKDQPGILYEAQNYSGRLWRAS